MNSFFKLIKKAYNKKIDASGLAIFRVLYGIVLLIDVVQLYNFRELIFDNVPFLEPAEIDFGLPLIIWIWSIIFLIFGLFTRFTLIINYFFSLIFIATINTYEYHMFYIYVAVNFILIFTQISKVGSLDTLVLKLKHSNTKVTYKPSTKTSVLSYFIIPLVGIGFVYFDSVFYKYSSPLWLNGLGVWLPASVAQITHRDLSFFLNQKWLMLFLGYLTLIFETIFIFTFFKKYWRIPLFIIGIGLHLGIFLSFPIPRFAFGVICLYLLLVPVKYWKRLHNLFKFKTPRLVFFYDEECPLCNRTRIIISYLDFFNAIEFKGLQSFGFDEARLKNFSKDALLNNIYSITPNNKVLVGIDTYRKAFKFIPILFPLYILLSIPGLYHFGKYIYQKIAVTRYVERCTEENCGFTPSSFPKNNDDMKITKFLRLKDIKVYSIGIGIILLIFLQLNTTYHASLISDFKRFSKFENSKLDNLIDKVSKPVAIKSKKLFGISKHAVFIDRHFQGYNHTLALVYIRDNGNEEWLPITNENGTLGPWQIGPLWAKWGFRINSANINSKDLEEGILDFTAFWSEKNNIDLDHAKFEIKVKHNDTPTGWEKDFLRSQLNNPWVSGGYVEWKNGKFYPYIKDIESI